MRGGAPVGRRALAASRPPAADLRYAPPKNEAGLAGRLRGRAARSLYDAGQIRLVDFALFAVLALGGLPIGVPGGLENVVTALIVVVALLRRPDRDLGRWQLLVPVLVIALSYIGVVSLFAEPTEFAADWRLRLLRITAVTALIFVMASGRIDIRSAVWGYVSVAVLNVPLFYAGLVPAPYGSYLTGVFYDKNVAGLAYCIFGLFAVYLMSSTHLRVAVAVLFGAGVWLTGSRTSIAAFLSALVWMLLAPKLPVVGRWILGGLLAIGIQVTAEDFSQIGVFSNRDGSDELRTRIDAASQVKLGEGGFFGEGLGEAYVTIADETWFFHNSYWTALIEGGWPWLLAIVGVTVVVMVQPFRRTMPMEQYFAQGIGIALLICATRLGEVFYTIPWAIGFAFAVRLLVNESQRSDEPGEVVTVERGSAGGFGRTTARGGHAE